LAPADPCGTPFADLAVKMLSTFQIRAAIRSLLRTPVITAVVVLSVGLGVGANVAIFSIFSQVLLRPLPVTEPDRLVNLVSPGPRSGSVSCGGAGDCDSVFSYPMFRDLERVQTVFTGLAAHSGFGASIGSQGSVEGGNAAFVSGSYFPVLGIKPALGRLLDRADDRDRSGAWVVVLSHDLWTRRFGGRLDAINESLAVNGRPFTIVGVAPQEFHGTTFGSRPLIYVPMSMREAVTPGWKGLDDRRSYWLYLFARLKPGISPSEARAALNAQYRAILTESDVPLQQGMRPSFLAQFRDMQMRLDPGAHGQSELPGRVRGPLLLLFGVAAIVLLICCANIASILMGRAAARSAEMAIRLSIGAARSHLIVQLLTESVLLALIGGAAGLLIGRWTLAAIMAIMPAGAGENLSPHFDGEMMLFAGLVSLIAGLLFGLAPALYSTRPNLVAALKASAGQPAGARSASRFRVTLGTGQLALSMVLLIAAGLFTRSLTNVTRVELGLRPEKLVVFGMAPGQSGYTPERTRAIFEAVEEKLASLPGVTGATASRVRLADDDDYTSTFEVEGISNSPDADMAAAYNVVGAGYFRTLGIPLMSGRDFTRSDTLGTPKVAIVNEAFVRKFGLGHEVIGRHMRRVGRGVGLDIEIVGLAHDSIYSQVKGQPPPMVAFPYRQDESPSFSSFYIRTAGSEGELMAAIPRAIRELDANLPIARVHTMSAQVQENVSLDRMVTLLSAAFALVATLLAALGLYGVLAYTLTQRTREFGLRMALGADSSNVRRLVLRQVVVMTCLGGAIGLAAAAALGRVAGSLLFQMSPRDPVVFASAILTLAAVAFCAGVIPAHRAARVDPMKALRYE
jgi:predicted permease